MDSVIVLLTHVWNDEVEDLYYKLSQCHKTLILFDASANEAPEIEDVRGFVNEDFQNINMLKWVEYSNINKFFNNFAPLILFKEELLQYEYIYLWEYDVRFNGDYKYLFNTDFGNYDLLITRLVDVIKFINLSWWADQISFEYYYEKHPLQKNKKLIDIPITFWKQGLFCFSRLSNKLFKIVCEEFPQYPEYFELAIPTLAAYNNCTIKDLCDYGVVARSWSWMPYTKQMTEYNKLYHAIK